MISINVKTKYSALGANEEEINKAIDNKDVNQLVDYILDGDADKLKDRSSDDEEVQELIDGVPKFEVVLIVRTTATYNSVGQLIRSPQIFPLIL